MRTAVDDADTIVRRLATENISVRLERETRATSHHVVRVGAYRTAEEADRARAQLAARGYPGFVVQSTPGSP